MTRNKNIRRTILLIVALLGLAKENSLFGNYTELLELFASTTHTKTNHHSSLRALLSSTTGDEDQPNKQNDDQVDMLDTTIDRLIPEWPNQDVAICACAKCGSSALYATLYQMLFYHPWKYKNAPWLQDVHSKRWRNAFNKTKPSSTEELVQYLHRPTTFTYALIRDPKERLISAWKSKVTCSTTWKTDWNDRPRLVKGLLTLANLPLPDEKIKPRKEWCLNLSDYLNALERIHQNGNAEKLDRHFLPQTENCFKHSPPKEWDVITTVDAPMASEKLWNALQLTASPARKKTIPKDFPSRHASGQWSEIDMSTKDKQILDHITQKEYDVLGEYLPRKNQQKEQPRNKNDSDDMKSTTDHPIITEE